MPIETQIENQKEYSELKELRNEKINKSATKVIPIKAKKFTIPKPEVSIEAVAGENERKITVEFTFNAHKFDGDDLRGLTELILERAKDGVVAALEGSINQEQKWLDKTRN